MTREDRERELLALCVAASDQLENLVDLELAREAVLDRVQWLVNRYNEKRARLVEEELERAGANWCTACKQVVEESTLRLLFVEEVRAMLGERDFDPPRLHASARLHRCCAICVGRLTMLGCRADGSRSFVYPARQSEQGYEVRRLEEWEALDQYFQLEKIPERLVDQLVAIAGLEPKLHFSRYQKELKVVGAAPSRVPGLARAAG